MFYTDIVLVCCIVFGICLALCGWEISRYALKHFNAVPEKLNSRLKDGKVLVWCGLIISIGTLIALVITLAVQH